MHRFTRRTGVFRPLWCLPRIMAAAAVLPPRCLRLGSAHTQPQSPYSNHHTHLGLFLIPLQQELLVETGEAPFNMPEKSIVHSGGRSDVQPGRSLMCRMTGPYRSPGMICQARKDIV